MAAIAVCIMMPSAASAHVLKVDGDLGAILHILPDDAPVVGVPVTYQLSFQEGSEDFSLENCYCRISFVADGEMIMQDWLAASSARVSENTVTFEEPGLYSFQVTGAPKAGAVFEPFTLEYSVRVSSGQEEMQPIPVLLWVGIGMGAALILLYANTQDNDKDRRAKRVI